MHAVCRNSSAKHATLNILYVQISILKRDNMPRTDTQKNKGAGHQQDEISQIDATGNFEIRKLINRDKKHKCGNKSKICVKIVAAANLPSRFGDFTVVAFYNNKDDKENAAFISGNVYGKRKVPVRIHSECLTGDVAGSLRCDCRDQLEASFKLIGKRKFGVLIYLRQEGRGIGFINKIKAYHLQDQGLDTYEANRALGFRADERDYAIAAHIIKTLDIKSIKLISNNPKKFNDLKRHGIVIAGRIPLATKPNSYNLKYLMTKRDKSKHLLENLPPHSKGV